MLELGEWLNLAIRWLHLTAGIAWIGSSFYFVWLDNHLKPPAQGGASGELWSVHGGGFYHNQKYQVAPPQMPAELHWFKWEAYFTWISGFSLLVVIYYFGAQSFLIDPAKAALTPAQAIGTGLASLASGWIFYDLLCRSPLGRHNRIVGVLWFLFLLAAAILLDHLLNARAAYIHVGAMMGTVMAANVFFIIIPNQRKVVADLVAGRQPDPALGAAGKRRSLHNNYMTLPVLFIMISHHYPMTYGAERPWLVLALVGLTGVAVRHIFNLRHRAANLRLAIVTAVVLAYVTVAYVSIEKEARAGTSVAGANVTGADIQPILTTRCASCHSARPANPAFSSPPLGIVLDDYDDARAYAERIKRTAVDSESMPLGNATGMTSEERVRLGAWIDGGMPK
ncbi:urate hydroxylase PuuD [Sphingopyxis sp.]|uniref:urate hydroxylase PuuD n=1 Tax=Sphingopyxis sp. TaxID=1908224 RepID=UPI002EDA2DCD